MKRETKISAENIERLSDTMLDIMQVIWASSEPIKSNEILTALSAKHTWKRATLHVLLTRLEEKGFIRSESISNYKVFSAAVSEDDYIAIESKNIVEKLCRGSFSSLVTSLINSRSLSAENIDELYSLLDEKKGAK